MDGWMPMMSPLGWVFMLLLWGFAILGVVCAIRWVLSRGQASRLGADRTSPLDILKKRYARGEITEEEFEQVKRGLE
jgi:putative membrane protein